MGCCFIYPQMDTNLFSQIYPVGYFIYLSYGVNTD